MKHVILNLISSVSPVIPSMSSVIPSMSSVIPSMSSVIPSVSPVIPRMSSVIPSVSRGIAYRFIPFILLSLTHCATHDSELQSARIVKEGEFTYNIAYQYLAEHDDDLWNARRKNDFSEDYNTASVASGAMMSVRRGFSETFDLGVNLSLGTSSIEPRFALFNGERYASAFGVKLVLPTFAWEVPTLYRYKAVWYNSYELLPNFAVYAAPHIEWKPFGGLKKEYRGISVGMLIGKDSGIVAEAMYARAQYGEDPKTYQQFMLGYAGNLDKLQGRLQYDPLSDVIKILPSFGSSVFPTPSIGLMGRYLTTKNLDYELSVDFGVGPIPNLSETKVGLMTTRLFAIRALYEFANSHFVKFGLARKEMRGDFNIEQGWHHIATVNHGLELNYEQAFSEWKITWVGVYIPVLFLPHSHSFQANYAWIPSDEMDSLANKWERSANLSLLNIHKEF